MISQNDKFYHTGTRGLRATKLGSIESEGQRAGGYTYFSLNFGDSFFFSKSYTIVKQQTSGVDLDAASMPMYQTDSGS